MFVWQRPKVLWVVKCWGVDLVILTGVCVQGPCSKSKSLPQGKQKRCAGHATKFIIRMMGAMSTLHIGSSAWIVFHPNKIFAYNWEVRNRNMSWKDLLKCKGWRSFKSFLYLIHSFIHHFLSGCDQLLCWLLGLQREIVPVSQSFTHYYKIRDKKMSSTEDLLGCRIMEFSTFALISQGSKNVSRAKLCVQHLEHLFDDTPHLEANWGLLDHSFPNRWKVHFSTFLPNMPSVIHVWAFPFWTSWLVLTWTGLKKKFVFKMAGGGPSKMERHHDKWSRWKGVREGGVVQPKALQGAPDEDLAFASSATGHPQVFRWYSAPLHLSSSVTHHRRSVFYLVHIDFSIISEMIGLATSYVSSLSRRVCGGCAQLCKHTRIGHHILCIWSQEEGE